MIKTGSRVRHIDSDLYAEYGVLEVLVIKNGFAVCRHGDGFPNYGIIDVEIKNLLKL